MTSVKLQTGTEKRTPHPDKVRELREAARYLLAHYRIEEQARQSDTFNVRVEALQKALDETA